MCFTRLRAWFGQELRCHSSGVAWGALVQSLHLQLSAEVDEHGDQTRWRLRIYCVYQRRLWDGAPAVSESFSTLVCCKSTLSRLGENGPNQWVGGLQQWNRNEIGRLVAMQLFEDWSSLLFQANTSLCCKWIKAKLPVSICHWQSGQKFIKGKRRSSNAGVSFTKQMLRMLFLSLFLL